MADWRKMVVDLVVADTVIDDNEVRVLRKHLYENGTIDRKGVDFLVDLRNLAQKRAKGRPLSPVFEKFFFKAIEDYILEDGTISTPEAKWLQGMLFADGKFDAGEKRFLTGLKRKATNDNKAFNMLYEECMAK
jgi:hypothetical protein